MLVIIIQTAYVFYYFQRDSFVGLGGWMGYPLLLPIGYWTGYQFDKAKFFSEKDGLTNLYNRRFVESHFHKIIKKVNNNDKKIFVLLLDCDKFKSINDEHGHGIGDLVLKKIALKLNEYNNKTLVTARWGGDEFIVVGSCLKDKEAVDLVNEIQQKLSSCIIPETDQQLSVSIGLAIQQKDEQSSQEMIKRADQDMYKHKRAKIYQNSDVLKKS